MYLFTLITRKNKQDTAYSAECNDMCFSDLSVIILSIHKTNKHNFTISQKTGSSYSLTDVPHSRYSVLTRREITALN